MRQLFNIIQIIMIFSLSSCDDMEDKVRGHWMLMKSVSKSQTEIREDSISEINTLFIGADGEYGAIHGNNNETGTWSIVRANQNGRKTGFLRVAIGNKWTDFEILQVGRNKQLVLQDTFRMSGSLFRRQLFYARIKM